MTARVAGSDPVAAARGLVAQLGAAAAEAERARELPDAVVGALREAGALHLCAPASIGGLEAHPRVFSETLATLARGDASAAWCAMVTSTTGLLAAYLDEETARQAFGPEHIAAGVVAPFGRARPVSGGLVVEGRWAFTSACRHADRLAFGCLLEQGEGEPPVHRMAIVDREDAVIHDTWDVAGLCATGSHDVELRDVRVPPGRTAAIVGASARHPSPLYAFPLFGLLAVGISSVALGTARGALEDLVALAQAKRPQGSSRRLAERPNVQAAVADAEARLRGASAFLAEAIDAAWAEAVESGRLTAGARVTVRLAATHATDVAAHVAERAYRLGGGSALYRASPLQRRFRDAHAATQHMMVSPATLEVAGKALLGLEVDASQL